MKLVRLRKTNATCPHLSWKLRRLVSQKWGVEEPWQGGEGGARLVNGHKVLRGRRSDFWSTAQWDDCG